MVIAYSTYLVGEHFFFGRQPVLKIQRGNIFSQFNWIQHNKTKKGTFDLLATVRVVAGVEELDF